MDGFYLKNAVRSRLTQNIAAKFDTVQDELVGAVKGFIITSDQGMFHILLKNVSIIQAHRRVGQGIFPANNATYCLSNIESGGCGCMVHPNVRNRSSLANA